MKTLKFDDFKAIAQKNVLTSTIKVVGGEDSAVYDKEYMSTTDGRIDVIVE